MVGWACKTANQTIPGYHTISEVRPGRVDDSVHKSNRSARSRAHFLNTLSAHRLGQLKRDGLVVV